MKSSQEWTENYNLKNKALNARYSKTLKFLSSSIPEQSKILDLGITNPLSELMEKSGYQVTNTKKGVDLDLDFEIVKDPSFEVVTAFEIFEHMVAPFNLLREVKAPYLVASIPLKLWFANAYWNENDPWDRHYHEFEPRQFDMLLEKSGWKIVNSEKWYSTSKKIGIRPLLRRFNYRYYIVYCERQ